jgi:hypothetical protein
MTKMTNTITPAIGRIVLFKHRDVEGRFADELPAIITRVHNDSCVNLMVFHDGMDARPWSSVVHTDDFEASGQYTGWRWMAYQKAVAAGEIAPTLHAAPAAG